MAGEHIRPLVGNDDACLDEWSFRLGLGFVVGAEVVAIARILCFCSYLSWLMEF